MLRKIITAVLLFAWVQITLGQGLSNNLADGANPLTYSVPFLTIPVSPPINSIITTVPDGTSGPGVFGNNGLLALVRNEVLT